MKKIIITLALVLITTTTFAQVGIGTPTPDASAELDLTASDKGFLPPRMTTTERDAISNPAEGLTIYNTTVDCLQFFEDSLWFDLCDGALQPGPVSDCTTTGFIAPFVTADDTEVVDRTSTTTGEIWMDRNLGAMRQAVSKDDCFAFGNFYQWGRDSDGHEFRDSPTYDAASNSSTGATNSNINPANDWHGEFIIPNNGRDDWLASQNDNLWQTSTGTNNPCPSGYRIPTESELLAEVPTANISTLGDFAYNSLYLTSEGSNGFSGRRDDDGGLDQSGGQYWTQTVSSDKSRRIYFENGVKNTAVLPRAHGFSVRCIKDD